MVWGNNSASSLRTFCWLSLAQSTARSLPVVGGRRQIIRFWRSLSHRHQKSKCSTITRQDTRVSSIGDLTTADREHLVNNSANIVLRFWSCQRGFHFEHLPQLQERPRMPKNGPSSQVHDSAYPNKPRHLLVDFENEREPPPWLPQATTSNRSRTCSPRRGICQVLYRWNEPATIPLDQFPIFRIVLSSNAGSVTMCMGDCWRSSWNGWRPSQYRGAKDWDIGQLIHQLQNLPPPCHLSWLSGHPLQIHRRIHFQFLPRNWW